MAAAYIEEEIFDILTNTGQKTGISKSRRSVHRDGDYHGSVHVWIFCESTKELILQRRADNKDSWPGLWDISSAGHISSGESSIGTARRELEEELGINLPEDAFEFLFVFLQECVLENGFIDNEFDNVYLVTIISPIPLEAFTLQESEVSAVKYIEVDNYRRLLEEKDPKYVPHHIEGQYAQLFDILTQRYMDDVASRTLALEKQLDRYAPVSLTADLSGLTDEDREVLTLLVKAADVINDIFLIQVWYNNLDLRNWLKEGRDSSHIDRLKWVYYLVNKSPWSCLDENQAFLTTSDSLIKSTVEATRPVLGWKGLEYRSAFPAKKPLGANFYPADMDKEEFKRWRDSLPDDKQKDATGFFHVVKRGGPGNRHDLYSVPFSEEYRPLLTEASEFLRRAGDLTRSPSLRRLLHSKAASFLSNDYFESDIAWLELDSSLDITIGPYETYEDALFGYKASFEAFIGVRDEKATAQLKLFGDNLQLLERNLPVEYSTRSEHLTPAPIRVIHLLYNSGDVRGPQTVAFNLPNDEEVVKERGTAMVMLKNVAEAKFDLILRPIAQACIVKQQRAYVEFESFFTHTVCHECCHSVGPHSITLPGGRSSTVRMELEELHSSIEEAKADIVGLWALRFFVDKGMLPESLMNCMYVSFLAGCFRSVRFGLEEAHGKGQALQFNWLFKNGGFGIDEEGMFFVNFDEVGRAVENLSREILTIQAEGNREAARSLLEEYCRWTPPLRRVFEKLDKIQVPVDIRPSFPLVDGSVWDPQGII